MRDQQRRRLHEAESSQPEYASPQLSVADAQLLADGVVYSRWFKTRWPWVTAVGVIVSSTHGRLKRNACARYREELFPMLEMPPKGRTFLRLLHELAHLCAKTCLHDRTYAATYLLLVNRFMPEAAKPLAALFKKHRVKFRPKRTLMMSEERKAQLRTRLTEMRAKRVQKGNDAIQSAEV